MKKLINHQDVYTVKKCKNQPNKGDETKTIFHSINLSDADKICIFYPIKLSDLDQACTRYGIGRNTMRNVAEEAGAVVRIGRLWRVNLPVMDAYFDNITE